MDKGHRKLKILLVSQIGGFGGVATYFRELLKYYADRQFDVTVCLSREEQGDDVIRLVHDLGMNCHTVHKRWKWINDFWDLMPFSLIADIVLFYRAYRKAHPDFIVTSSTIPDGFLGLAVFPCPFIGVIHTYPLAGSGNISSRVRCALRNFILKKLFTAPEKHLLTVSEYSRQQMLNLWKLPPEAISVIHNFGGQGETGPALESEKERVVVLTLGHVTNYKNPFVWIEVAEQVIRHYPGRLIDFIWGGDGDLLEACRERAAARGLSERIKFVGRIADVSSYYAHALLYYQPSILESHGVSIVEAMRYGLPCVVSNVGGIPESVQEGVNGFLLPPDDASAMRDAIVKLIDNELLRQEMRKNSLEIYNKKFSYPVWKQKMDELYR